MAGIIDTIKLTSTLVFAIPAALAGLEFFVRDQPAIGTALLALAVGSVLLERYLTLPTDVPAVLVERVVGAVAKAPEHGDGTDPDE